METQTFEHEVAFSFCQEDETLSYQLNDQIQDRFKTFIYSQRQNELVGKDGEIKLKEVYGKTARTVVILYRDKWGTTLWTRVEEQAIRDRAHYEGYDFTTFIYVDPKAKGPEWLSPVRIYHDLTRFGIESAAAIVLTRIQEKGGETRPETVEDQRTRLIRNIEQEQARKNYVQSKHANYDADNLFSELFTLIKEKFNELEDREHGIYFGREEKSQKYVVRRCENFNLIFRWRKIYDSLDEAFLIVSLTKDDLSKPYFNETEEITISGQEYDFDVTLNLDKGWTEKQGEKKFFTNEALVEKWIKLFMEKVGEERIKKIRG